MARGIGCDEEQRVADIDVVRGSGDPGRRVTGLSCHGSVGLRRKRVQCDNRGEIGGRLEHLRRLAGPGTLCTRVPAGMSTLSGEPGALRQREREHRGGGDAGRRHVADQTGELEDGALIDGGAQKRLVGETLLIEGEDVEG